MFCSLKLCKKLLPPLMDPTTLSLEHQYKAQKHRLISLRDKKVKDLITAKRSLVEVPCTATLAHTMNQLVSNHVLAVPVAAPPGHWIGAGGSMIMESDKRTGAVKKQYIGIVTMLDILAHIAADEGPTSSGLDRKMAAPVSSFIGHCLEGLSLWTLNPNTEILDCMEVFSKGIHRALVPLETMGDSISAVELVETAPSYHLVSQMDVVRFLRDHHALEMEGIMSRSVRDLGAVNRTVYAITDQTKLVDVIKCMRAAMINAVPIVASEVQDLEEDNTRLLEITGQGRKLVGTFSATDLRGCHLATLQSWLSASALDFTEKVSRSPLAIEGSRPKELVTCTDNSSLSEVMDKAVEKHVHRIWVVDDRDEGRLITGVVSLTDMIRALRVALLST